jgi:hypothetical protein
MKRIAVILAVFSIMVLVPTDRSSAATADIAAASVDPPTALIGQPVTFTSTKPCTIACALTWRRPDLGIPRFGGQIVGNGESITLTFPEPGTYEVVLDLSEVCVGTTQLVCDSFASVFVAVVSVLPVDPTTTTTIAPDVTTTVAPDVTTTTVAPDATTTTAAPDTTTSTVVPTTTTADPTTTIVTPITTTSTTTTTMAVPRNGDDENVIAEHADPDNEDYPSHTQQSSNSGPRKSGASLRNEREN